MIKVAGFFLVRKDNKILVCHPTRHPLNFWSIPKGRLDNDEQPIDAAIRETMEESNVDLSDWQIIHNIEPIPYPNNKKILYPFVFFENQNKLDFDTLELKCNSFVEREKGGFPEMDAYNWVTIDEAKKKLHFSQIAALLELEKLIIKLKKKKANG